MHPYIKIYPIENYIELSMNEEHDYTAFKLADNRVWFFADDIMVTKVNTEIIIRN